MRNETLEHLQNSVNAVVQEPAGYFCYEDEYESDDGDVLFGSVLDIEYIIGSDGGFIGVTVCVGTGGPHLELSTKENQVIGYWSGCEPVRKYYPNSQEVAEFWQEMYESLRTY